MGSGIGRDSSDFCNLLIILFSRERFEINRIFSEMEGTKSFIDTGTLETIFTYRPINKCGYLCRNDFLHRLRINGFATRSIKEADTFKVSVFGKFGKEIIISFQDSGFFKNFNEVRF